ncbi:hypothetical protein GDO81_002911 [Engystomops pustulosus]|uniref:Lung adenoma susceptibility protein 2 n=1 Tax=Engystomops pustulosus TaxID=76066 RepID=A0AAV7DRR5_ENGPU|nr:hypothetical protein GDO81_002911 [Engystomops pustulosus]
MARPSSPDSSISISSLLASCSLGSSSRSDAARSSIQYKDRLYDSASRALEDYIMDHQAARTGTITICPTTAPASPARRAHSSVRRTTSLTRSRYVARDPDLLSLTTDDLLGFPADGSLPFTQASERKRRTNLKKHHGFSSHVTSSLTPSSLRRTEISALDLHDHRLRFQDLQRRGERSHQREQEKSYPRWLTSQKSDLGVSGITSIPSVQYPVWIKDHRLLDDINRGGPVPNYLSGSSSLDSLDRLPIPRYERRRYEIVKSGNVTDSIKHLARSDLDIVQNLHTPVKNHPVQKSEQTGDITHKDVTSLPPPRHNQSPRTEDVLEAERSWENLPYAYKSPVHVLCDDEENREHKTFKSNFVEEFLKDCAQQEKTANTFSGGNHHGPVEALKHILFNLQAFQQNFSPEPSSEQTKEFKKVSTEASESELQRADQEIFPVNKSLQKALQHLSRLKELVGDCNVKKKEDVQT